MIYRRSLKPKIGILILDMRIREERWIWKNLQEKDEHDNKKRKMSMKISTWE